jgi:nucleoside-diphosphate-sugar epimerase
MLSISEERSAAPVLVTGGRGFIGSHLVRLLVSHGHEVVSVDVAPVGTADTGARELTVDIREHDALAEVFARHPFGTVFDLASFTDAGLSRSAYERNIVATDTMTRVVAKSGVARYVFFSTQFVFRKEGVSPSGPFDYAPFEAYGESKVASEKLVVDRIPQARRLILRPTYVWGPGLERFRIGLLSRLEKGQMLVSNDPEARRYYGYVETVAEQAYRLMKSWDHSSKAQVLYLSDDAISLPEFCRHLIGAMGAGRYRSVSPGLIRILGNVGGMMKTAGLRAPIDQIQARELTSRYPIPLAPTLELTGCKTDYPQAARKTVDWARSKAGAVN